ncbi:MAG: DUF1559 domain-containing protein [Planctomycetaceae bacterium]
MNPLRHQTVPVFKTPAPTSRVAVRGCRRGFTIPETAVILIILLNLLAVLVPFVLNMMETSRQNRCADNLRQIGAGLASFDEKGKQFPVGQVARKTASNKVGRYADPAEATSTGGTATNSGASWVTGILPHLGGKASGLQWDHKQSVVENRTVGMVELEQLYCPSRRSGMQATGAYANCLRVTADWTQGGNDYAACTGSGISFNDEARQTYYLTQEQANATYRGGHTPFSAGALRRGVFGVNSKVTATEIGAADGLAYVMTVAERRVSGSGETGVLQSSDGWAWGGPATLFSARSLPRTGRHYDEADSSHPYLIQVVMADGRVRRISVDVDLGTWQNLGDYSSGHSIDHPNFNKW